MKNRKKLVAGKLLKVSPSTIKIDIFRISAIYEIAGKPRTKGGWGMDVKNPVHDIQLPKLPTTGRQRRLERDEEPTLMQALSEGLDGLQMVAFCTIAIETGMRRSEILTTRFSEIRDTERGWTIIKYDTKNHHPRTVFLSKRAGDVIEQLLKNKPDGEFLFTLNQDQVATRWDIARAKIGHDDLRLHDLRHEAISRLADKGASPGLLVNQSGHRSMQTLLRYVNVSERVARELLDK